MSAKGLVHTLLMYFSPLAAQKSKFPKLIFWTTPNNHLSYVKHDLGIIYVLFTGIGCVGGGGGF